MDLRARIQRDLCTIGSKLGAAEHSLFAMNGPADFYYVHYLLVPPTRSMLIKLLHFKNRDRVLRAAHTLEEVSFNGNHISIVPDFSVAIKKRHLYCGEEEAAA